MIPQDPTIQHIVQQALLEDIGKGDVTATLIPQMTQQTAEIMTRSAGVLCGIPWVESCFKQLDEKVVLNWEFQEGDTIPANAVLCRVRANARALVSGERTALNFLQLLSGIATLTRRYVQKIAHTKAQLFDTRKTIPGLRHAQKYAVHCGGGFNHRMGLDSAYLIKENHIVACGSIEQALNQAREQGTKLPIEIEVESLDELKTALDNGADLILLDNFSIPDLNAAVQLTNRRAILEASGNITLNTIHTVAETGVNRIAVGDLTKSITPLDLSMRFI